MKRGIFLGLIIIAIVGIYPECLNQCQIKLFKKQKLCYELYSQDIIKQNMCLNALIDEYYECKEKCEESKK